MDSDRITGKLKEAEGSLTGDETRETQGKAEGAWGKAKDKAGDAKDEVKEKAGELKDKLSDRFGRDEPDASRDRSAL